MARKSRNAPGSEPESKSKSKGVHFAGSYLYLSVFLSGGSILVLEIAAGRVMAPHFGNTLFNWTSMIGVILAALSVGYAVGGRLADKNPSLKLFYGLMIAGAGLVALVPPLRLAVLPLLESAFSLRTGPVVGGLLLFAAPSVALAALTPFAVRLAAHGEGTLGTVTGNLFTWSTVGSIAGTFLTGFVLVPLFGLNAIFLATALALAAVGGGGLYLAKGETGSSLPRSKTRAPPCSPARPQRRTCRERARMCFISAKTCTTPSGSRRLSRARGACGSFSSIFSPRVRWW